MKKQMMLSIAFLCFAVTVFAQNTAMTFLFPIEEATGNNRYFLAAENFGFEEGAKGELYGLYDQNNKSHNQLLGTATITKVDGISVHFDYQVDANTNVKKGDLLAFKIDVPKTNHNRILYKMFALNIRFLDVYDKYLFEGFDFGKIIPESEEQALMNDLLAEIHFVGGAMKEQSETYPKITEKSRFGEMDLYSAMEAATYKDLRSFLRYIEAKPLKYQGRNWRISEVFATWIDGGTPCTIDDISELLLNVEEENWQKYSKNLTQKAIEEVAENWRNEAENLADNREFDKAFSLVNKSMNLGEKTENQSIIAWSYYSKGYLFGKEENAKKSIEYYEKSKSIFEKSNEKVAVIVVGTNIGNALNNVGNHKLALEYLDEAYKTQNKLVGKNTDNEVLNNLKALILKNQGDSYKGLEKYDKALKKYEEGLSYVQNATLDKGITRKMTIYLSLSELHEILGNEDLAAEYSTKATDTFMEMIWNN